jgi:hypothetical protein
MSPTPAEKERDDDDPEERVDENLNLTRTREHPAVVLQANELTTVVLQALSRGAERGHNQPDQQQENCWSEKHHTCNGILEATTGATGDEKDNQKCGEKDGDCNAGIQQLGQTGEDVLDEIVHRHPPLTRARFRMCAGALRVFLHPQRPGSEHFR